MQEFHCNVYTSEVCRRFPVNLFDRAVVISKKFFDNLPADLKEILLRNGKIYMDKLSELGRKDNQMH